MFWLDTTILTLLALAALVGAWTGFVYQVARILSISLSVYAAVTCNEAATTLFQESLLQEADPRITRGVAYAAVFLAVYLVLFYVLRLVRKGLKAADLVAFDRFLGAVAGTGKMSLVLCAVCLGLANYPVTKPWFEKSKLAPAFAEGMEIALLQLPDDYLQPIQENLATLARLGKVNVP